MESLVRLEEVRLIMLRFSFSNPKVVPMFVRRIEPETEKREKVDKTQIPGRLIIQPTNNVSLRDFPFFLRGEGYQLVDGFYQTRFKNSYPYHVVRFDFVRSPESLEISDFETFQQIQDLLFCELLKLCREALWRVRIFLNPFFENGKKVIGQHSVSINLEAREPRPIPSDYFLWIKDKSIQLLENKEG